MKVVEAQSKKNAVDCWLKDASLVRANLLCQLKSNPELPVFSHGQLLFFHLAKILLGEDIPRGKVKSSWAGGCCPQIYLPSLCRRILSTGIPYLKLASL